MQFAAITDRLKDTGSAKWAIHQRCREMQLIGADIIELTIGEPDVMPDSKLVEIAHQAMKNGRVGYSNGRGEPDLLDALVDRYQKRHPGVARENILCFPGTQTALFATMMGLTQNGDGVLVGDPFYATYEGVIRASGAHPVSVALHPENGFRMKVEDLSAALTSQTKVLLLNSPQNPSGAVLDKDDVEAIGAFCVEHGLWLVCDEVYEELVFSGSFFSPFDNPAFADNTVVLSSISKSCAAPGFRSGWAVGSPEFCERILPLSETMLFGNQPFIADMTAYALRYPPTTSETMRADYSRRASALFADLERIDGITPYMPQSGMFLLADVSDTGFSGDEFAWKLLENGVAVMPGSSFGANASNLIRLSLTVPDASLKMAAERIKLFRETLS